MEHVIRANENITDVLFETIDHLTIECVGTNGRLVDPAVHYLVCQLFIKASEAIKLLRACRDSKNVASIAHSSPVLKLLPCEIDEFKKLCDSAKWELNRARNLLRQAAPEELAKRNMFYDSRKDFPTAADIVNYLLVIIPTTALMQLLSAKTTSEVSQNVLQRRQQDGKCGDFF